MTHPVYVEDRPKAPVVCERSESRQALCKLLSFRSISNIYTCEFDQKLASIYSSSNLNVNVTRATSWEAEQTRLYLCTEQTTGFNQADEMTDQMVPFWESRQARSEVRQRGASDKADTATADAHRRMLNTLNS